MKKQILTTLILLGMTFGAFAQQFEANGTGWTLRLFNHDDQNEEELGMGLFEDANNPWEEEMEIDMEMYMEFAPIRGIAGGGLFGRGETPTGVGLGYTKLGNSSLFGLPGAHGWEDDVNAPLGSGALLLVGFGAAYLMAKKRKEEE